MLTTRFNSLFERLVSRFHTYHDTPRSPATVLQLASARIALDQTRAEITEERMLITQHSAPTAFPRRTSVPADEFSVLNVQGMISN